MKKTLKGSYSLLWFSAHVFLPPKSFLRQRVSLNHPILRPTTSKPKQARVCSAKTSPVLWESGACVNICVLVIRAGACAVPSLCFCGVFFLGPEGVFLEIQTSLKESKIESWESEREVNEGRRD